MTVPMILLGWSSVNLQAEGLHQFHQLQQPLQGKPLRWLAGKAHWRGLRPVGPLTQHAERPARRIVQNQRLLTR